MLTDTQWAMLEPGLPSEEWKAVPKRYEKTASSFMGVLCLAAGLDWLKT